MFKKEKEHLLPLPNDKICSYYKNITINAKVNSNSLFRYKGNLYSVPIDFIGKNIVVKVIDNNLYVYYGPKLIALHTISNKKINYQENHHLAMVGLTFKNFNAAHAMVKVAGFPHLKELKDFDFEFQPKINKQQFLDFESLRFLENNSSIILIGNSGVGKTHLATSIGIAAAKKRVSTYFIKCQDLIEQLKKAYLENKLDDRIKHFSKYKLLIIDEIGYLPIGEQEAKMFFQLIDRRYEKKSTIVTSNINLSDWNQIFVDNMLASAILDRLVHHSTIINILGNSYRTATALSKIVDKNN